MLTQAEVAAVLSGLAPEIALLGRLLYGTGMRLMEGLRLRIKDVDLDRRVIVVRDGKGGKDRVVMLPRSLEGRAQVAGPGCALRLGGRSGQWSGSTCRTCPGVQVPRCGQPLGLVLAVPLAHPVHRSA